MFEPISKNDDAGNEPATATTYHGVARAVLETRCTSCHTAGGIAPFALDTYEAASLRAGEIIVAIESGHMPPWMPSTNCRRYEDERLMTTEEKDAIAKWVADGAVAGDPADYVAPVRPPSVFETLGPPSLSMAAGEPYTPSAQLTDDYRCFPLDATFDVETFVKMSRVIPERREIVHHVIVFMAGPASRAQIMALDQAEAGPGYTCFGGPGVAGAQNIGAYVPGSVGGNYANDAAIRIVPGSQLVLQVHYNTVAAPPAPDRTRVELWTDTTPPAYVLRVQGLPHLGIAIPAGDPASHQSRTFTNPTNEAWVAVGTAAHMHTLGTRAKLAAEHVDGTESCIIEIPQWDFHWQQSYRFREGETVTIAPGESVRLECDYDNSAANQPYINGVQQEPRDVSWGEGTYDEMCLGYLLLIEPYAPLPEPGQMCGSFDACYSTCAAGRTPITACVLQCASQSGTECAQCVVPSVVQCVVDDCPMEADAAMACVQACQAAPDPRACARNECASEVLAFDACAAPQIEANACDPFVAACGADI
jgi:hypothetical protein